MYFERDNMGKTIMVVDDSASLRQVVGIALKGAGYEVVEAADGQIALGKLGGQRVNLIVCDVNMPNMDGITFVRELKMLPSHKFTPVIMLTTETQEAKKREGQAAGAKAWVVKPFKPEVLLGAVQKLVLP
ncbi:two-component system, chemotaxis family, response regulator CheY [Pseudoduganella namucuonensis]|uniref:Two-component system, chemotaxis family, response regulator CheY n=2 Tax=Pseudoduganella namucuonensis TaxID=1035707 RepID=A0A1I7I5W8_9BURK|nr:two-component system, chemotaxis family, response regulator CheY [Pseudoduganella namucuonensis]